MLGDLGKLIVAKDFKKLPKVQKIARSGHTGWNQCHKQRFEYRNSATLNKAIQLVAVSHVTSFNQLDGFNSG